MLTNVLIMHMLVIEMIKRDPYKRTANLLGAFALTLTDRMRDATEEAAGFGATAPAALVQIGSYPGESIGMLRLSLGLGQSATSRLVERLFNHGLVEKAPGPDSRQIALSLTPLGEEAKERVLASRQEILSCALKRLTAEEQDSLTSILEKLLNQMVGSRSESDSICRLCDILACPQDLCPAEPDAEPTAS